MYIRTNADGEPFYGYSLGGAVSAYHYVDGANGNWHLVNGGSTRFTVADNGYVGIGKSNPIWQLEVLSGGGPAIRAESTGTTAEGVYGVASAATGTTRGVWGDSSSVSGTGVWGRALASSGTNFGVRGSTNSAAGYAGFFEGRGYFSSNLGIGTGAPAVRLHVEGGSDAEPAGGGFLVLGSVGAGNVAFDNNEIMARNNGGVSTLFLNHNGGDVHVGQGSGGTTRLVTPVIQITGGSDLSEGFEIASHEGVEARPGMVVVIDPANPGRLMPSTESYDCKVAGVISGAGGVNTGMIMGQSDSIADGRHPVALTGRVYCYVDATERAIQPGDLLTTSATPGHAMKVIDRERAGGAIIGKAMTSLAQGEKGLVLVLVNLQ